MRKGLVLILGPLAYGPLAYGSLAYGPLAYGSLAYGPLAYGPLAYGPLAYGPLAYGPLAYGPLAYGPLQTKGSFLEKYIGNGITEPVSLSTSTVFVSFHYLSQDQQHNSNQGILTEGEGSVQLTSSLR
jgi:hypothetical protein